MRLLHPETLRTVAMICKDEDFDSATVSRKTVISHAWAEVFKFLASEKSHPKMFIHDRYHLGMYMKMVYTFGNIVGCNLDPDKLVKYPEVYEGFEDYKLCFDFKSIDEYFDDNYLFSDVISLYFKGLNIAQYVYGDDWRRLIPIENLEEIHRVVGKAIKKKRLT